MSLAEGSGEEVEGQSAVCRLCLGQREVQRMFPAHSHARCSAALALVTGLQIEMDDGLPQTICTNCICSVNAALDLRNRSHKAERKLIQWGYKRINPPIEMKTIKNEDAEPMNPRVTDLNIQNEKKELSCFETNVEFSDNNDPYASEIENVKHPLNKIKKVKRIHQKGVLNIKTPDVKELKKQKCKVDKKKRYEHLVDGQMGPGNPGPFECKACKKVLKSWSSFRTHAKIHLGFDFMCEFCGKTFIAVTMLQRHCMSQHGTEKTYRCKYCDHRTLDSERLKIHERRDHTGDRPYVCDACAASFHTRRNLVNHLAVHMTQRTVQCAKCPAKFKSVQHLACHTSKVHTHRDIRMLCYLCDNTYTKYENVRKHLVKVHGVPRQHQLAIRRLRVPVEA